MTSLLPVISLRPKPHPARSAASPGGGQTRCEIYISECSLICQVGFVRGLHTGTALRAALHWAAWGDTRRFPTTMCFWWHAASSAPTVTLRPREQLPTPREYRKRFFISALAAKTSCSSPPCTRVDRTLRN